MFTGRRRSEVLGLRAADLIPEGAEVFYSYQGKGGKAGRRELPQPEYQAIVQSLAAWGKTLDAIPSRESLWPSRAATSKGLTSGTFYGRLRAYLRLGGLPLSGVASFDIAPPSCEGMQARRWKRSAASWTIAA